MQGKLHPVQVKEPYGNSIFFLLFSFFFFFFVGLHPATRSVQCTMNERKKERQYFTLLPIRMYAIAHKIVLFSIFHNMIWIVLKYCFC